MKKKFVVLMLLFFIPLITTLGYSVWTVVGEINIKPKYNPNSLFYTYLHGQTVTYNGQPQCPISTDLNAFNPSRDDYEVKYKLKGESTYEDGFPINAGEYYLYFDHENDNYTEPSDVLFIIEKAVLDSADVEVIYGSNKYFTTETPVSDIKFKAVMSNTVIGEILTESSATIRLNTNLVVGLNKEYSYTISNMTNYNDYTGVVVINTYAIVKYYQNDDLLKSDEIEPGKTIETSKLPEAAIGYQYDSWYLDKDLTNKYNEKSQITNNLDLYVKYSLITYYVYTYINQDEYGNDNVYKTYEYNVQNGVNIENLADNLSHPEYGQYWFSGWVGSNITINTKDLFIDPGTEDIILYGNWVVPIKANSIELDYNASIRSFSDVKAKIEESISFKYLNNSECTEASEMISIKLMHNGYYYSGEKNKKFLDDQVIPEKNIESSDNLAGSIYLVYIELDYTIIPSFKYVIYDNLQTDDSLKINYNELGRVSLIYNTVSSTISGTSTMCTMEEALLFGSGDIIPMGDDSLFVETCFSSISIELLNKILDTNLSSHMYTLNDRKMYIPFSSSSTVDYEEVHDVKPATSKTYSCLTLWENIVLNVQNGGIITLGSKIAGSGNVGDHGTLANFGNINLESGTYYNSYGFTKGSGLIDAKDGSHAKDVLKLYDYSTASSSLGVYGVSTSSLIFSSNPTPKGAFPIVSWSFHNIACDIKINYGAELTGLGSIYGTSAGFHVVNFYLIGKNYSDSNKCLFKPASNASSTNYIYKSVESSDKLDITKSNQENTQKEKIIIDGNYVDSTMQISMKVSASFISKTITFKSSTDVAIPIGYMDFVLNNGTLTVSNSSFLFLCGTTVTVNPNANLVVNGNSYIAFDTYATTAAICPFFNTYCNNKVSAKLILNGVLSGTGYIGGTIDNNGSISISNQIIKSIRFKSSASEYGTLSNYSTTLI